MPFTVFDALQTSLNGMGVVFIVLILLSLIIFILFKAVQAFSHKPVVEAATAAPVVAPVTPPGMQTLPENQSAGSLDLNNVSAETAALIMAIVSHKSKIPLNQLRFVSIRQY